jgi:Skp family chaperone for outer membrane proteins
MKNRERIVIYGLLAALVAVNIGTLLGSTERTAVASPWPDETTPVDVLSLAGPDEPLHLRNVAGRVAWGDTVHERVYSVAYVYIGKVLRQLMNSETFREEREQLGEELAAEDTEYRERGEAIQERGEALDPESDEAKAAYEEYLAVVEEYRAFQQLAMRRRAKLDATHLEQAYRELLEAVEVIAEQRDIDVVHRFIPPHDPFETDNPEQAMIAIRLRTTLRSPSSLDITDDVLEELSLELE